MALDYEKLQDSPQLLDYLLACEDVVDTFDLYCFKNWLHGTVCEGPIVRRHWVGMNLLFPLNKMPDPRGALRLIKHGVKVTFEKVHREDAEADGPQWMVKMEFPRRLLGQMNAAELDFYEDDVDVDDVEDAQDTGLNDESGYKEQGDQESLPDQIGGPNAPL
jgi:hypothetical protein